MTDRPVPDAAGDDLPEVDPDFELASARHDREAGDAEPGGADVARHLRIVGAVSQRVVDVPPATAGLLDDHLAVALAAFDDVEPVPAAAATADAASVVRLTGRRPWRQRAPLGAVAAGVAVVALVGAIGFASVTDGDDDAADTAATAFDADDGAEGADEEMGEVFDASGGDTAGGSALAAGEREAYATYDELAAALRVRNERADATTTEDVAPTSSASASPAPESGGGAGSAPGCDAVGAAGIDPATIELVVAVVVDGRLVSAIVHAGEGGTRLTAVDETTCAVVDQRAL